MICKLGAKHPQPERKTAPELPSRDTSPRLDINSAIAVVFSAGNSELP